MSFETFPFLVRKSNDVVNVVRVASRPALTGEMSPPFSTTAFFAEDLILAEDRTTERDRKKITEGEDACGFRNGFKPCIHTVQLIESQLGDIG